MPDNARWTIMQVEYREEGPKEYVMPMRGGPKDWAHQHAKQLVKNIDRAKAECERKGITLTNMGGTDYVVVPVGTEESR